MRIPTDCSYTISSQITGMDDRKHIERAAELYAETKPTLKPSPRLLLRRLSM